MTTSNIITCGLLPSLHTKPFHRLNARIPIISSPTHATLNGVIFLGQTLQEKYEIGRRTRRSYVCNAVGSGSPPPPSNKPPFNFLHWIMGVAAMILPLFRNKWASLLRIKNEVETAVEVAEEVVEAVGKVAEEVEKAAEEISRDLPEGGRLRGAVDFVEHVAEKASDDAHLVHDFIDKVQEVEEKVEKSVEYWEEEVSMIELPKEEEITTDVTQK